MKVLLKVKFPDTDSEIIIENPIVIPNLGEAVNNDKGLGRRFFVELKEIYYNTSITIIYITAKENKY